MNAIPFRDRIIPWYFVMFFVVIVAVNVVMATLAIRTLPGVVTDHPYERGLAYNEVVDAEKKQEALGWVGSIDYANGLLRFTLRDRDHHLLRPQTATADIIRPMQSGMDFSTALAADGTKVTFPAKGLWQVRVNAMYNGTHYQQTQRIVVP